MDDDSARALRFLLIKAAVFIALPATLALLAAFFLV
ncbi:MULTISPECIES: phosphoribosylformylglycinamidine synthase-associated small membrane protein [Stappia]|nr:MULTISPECIES: phosphoribosylformylglycinamidine synthase-associated small membrane protein [Stappia]MCA1299983.1 phosphoribosylformylglycinamidine synthase [Stappia indica]